MDFSQSKAILKKINALHDSAAAFEGNISAMERDLLLHYLREMYEVVLSDDMAKVKPAPAPEVVKRVERAATHVQTPVAQEQRYSPPPVVQYEAPQPAAPVYREPVAYNTQPVTHTNGSYHTPQPVIREPEVKVDEAILSLFEEDQKNSSRFSQLPISDIGKSMGLNDKILTRNELFNGSSGQMDTVIGKLNSFSNFEDAKSYLIKGVAVENEWGSTNKRSKAEVFIKLIKRKYL